MRAFSGADNMSIVTALALFDGDYEAVAVAQKENPETYGSNEFFVFTISALDGRLLTSIRGGVLDPDVYRKSTITSQGIVVVPSTPPMAILTFLPCDPTNSNGDCLGHPIDSGGNYNGRV